LGVRLNVRRSSSVPSVDVSNAPASPEQLNNRTLQNGAVTAASCQKRLSAIAANSVAQLVGTASNVGGISSPSALAVLATCRSWMERRCGAASRRPGAPRLAIRSAVGRLRRAASTLV
jgi:hypothetical protein